MELLQNRKFAVIVMVGLIVCSIFIGSGRSLRTLTSEADRIFNEGAKGNGVGVAGDLKENAAIAGNLLTVARRYLNEDSAAVKTVSAAIESLENADTPAAKFAANAYLTDCVATLGNELIAMGSLSERDYEYAVKLPVDLQGNNDRIQRDPYHDKAAEINEKLNTFPASLLKTLTGVKNVATYD